MAKYIGRKGQVMSNQQPFSALFPEPVPYNGFAPDSNTYGDLGQVVVDYANSKLYMLASQQGGIANWIDLTTTTPTFTSLTVNGPTTVVGVTNINQTGNAATTIGNSATGGAVNLATSTTFGLTAIGVATLSAASWGFTGNTLFTGTLGTVGAGITSATFLTASNGDITSSTVGKGIIVNPPAIPTPAAGPITVNARHGAATFTTVSISGTTPGVQSFVINNSLVTSNTQLCQVSLYGATTGAAPTIQSVVLSGSGHTITITVTNAAGVGANANQVDNLTFVFWLLN